MASIVIRNYGGMAPSANAKALDISTAIYAANLDLRFTDFRPLPVPAAIATLSAGGTLYKFEGSGGFISKPGIVNFVRGPIPTDATERTYYTGDGLPKVTDAGGSVRQLGVPQPSNAPAVAVVGADIYTEDKAADAQAASARQFATIAWTELAHPYYGVNDANLAPFVPSADPRKFGLPIAGVLQNSIFTSTNRNQQVLVTPLFSFDFNGAAENPGAITGYSYLSLRGVGVAIGANTANALAAIKSPVDGTTQLLTAAQIAAAVTALNAAVNTATAARRDESISKITALKNEFASLAANGSDGAGGNAALVRAFYAKSDVVSAIDAAVALAVSQIQGALVNYHE